MKLHTGDTVVVISGKDKGKTGTVMRVLGSQNHVVIGGINMRTRHIKKNYQEAGRIIRYEASIDASKVMLVDPKTKKPSRIGFTIKDGKKKRIAKRSGEEVVKVRAPKAVKKAAKKTDDKEVKTDKAVVEKKEAPEMPAGPKQPFWKKLQFGSAVQSEGGAEAPKGQEHVSTQSIPRKSAGRGS